MENDLRTTRLSNSSTLRIMASSAYSAYASSTTTIPLNLERISSMSFCLKQLPVGLLGDGIMATFASCFTISSTSSWNPSVRSTSIALPPFILTK